MEILVGGDGALASRDPAGTTAPLASPADLPDGVAPRWVWADAASAYLPLLAAGTRVERCHDLRLAARILHHALGYPIHPWLDTTPPEPTGWAPEQTLWDDVADGPGLEAVAAEYEAQLTAVAASPDAGRLRLLLAIESAGALIAVEMHEAGLPWDRETHDALLEEALGPRPPSGRRPPAMETLATEIRAALGAPTLNPDSPPEVLKALHRAGLPVASTSKWDLDGVDHPGIAPLLAYKKLSRLLSANGWGWRETWVEPGSDGRRGRFRPDYVPGGVVTGRWATRGGGAMQIPKNVRAAVIADPGWRLVVADAAQIEPRVLAAMSRDVALADAGRGGDLYQGLVDTGIVPSRPQAKVAMLGALYGATTGDSALLMPNLVRAYPRAVDLVERAARAGERGESVRTWLGRTSPRPGAAWQEAQGAAAAADAGAAAEQRARRQARDWGRFTRNFVVQGSAAEWALAWMAGLRTRLAPLGDPRLCYFLHDEVIVHTPAELADEVAGHVEAAAQAAGTLLFGGFPITFPLDVAVVTSYAEAT